jgi:DNA-directed RNA polymerase subunit omega
MSYIAIDNLRDKTKSAYKLVILAARRAIDLSDGASPLVEPRPGEKPVNIALREILDNKISFKIKE